MNKIAIIGAAVAIVTAYLFGYSTAETKGELKLEQYKTELTEAATAAQNAIKADYEKRLQNLNADLNSIRDNNNKRLRELEQYKRRAVNMDTCNRERERLARAAIGLENVAERAVGYLEQCRE